VGRCTLQAPDIDGRTLVRSPGMVHRGQVIHAVASDSVGYDVEADAGRRES